MPKAKYYFNTSSLKYEKVVISIRKRLLSVIGFLSTAVVFSVIIVLIAYSYLDSPKEKQLRREVNELNLQYEILEQRFGLATKVLRDIERRDDNIYRVIFEAEPIPETVREAGYGGINKYRELEGFENSDLMVNANIKMDKLEKQLYIQSKSFDEIFKLAKSKNVLLASIPGIQPVKSTQSTIASGFGFRIHPIYKTTMMHTGMDFTAPIGTPIFATGNGTIESTEYNGRGYGNNVVISHGFGYKTLYGHMSRFNVRAGQRINRGDIIGYVGNTGSSTGPHVHYEVIRNGEKINPVNFFYNDLTPAEFEKMLELSSQQNQSFD